MRRRPVFGGPRPPRRMGMGMRRLYRPGPLPGPRPLPPRARWFSLGVFTLLAFPASGGMVKLHRDDVQRIEQHSGTSVRNMSEEELRAAITALQITGTAFTDEDRQAAGWRQPPAKLTEEDLDLLERLNQMMYSGQITEEEYEARRKQILGL